MGSYQAEACSLLQTLSTVDKQVIVTALLGGRNHKKSFAFSLMSRTGCIPKNQRGSTVDCIYSAEEGRVSEPNETPTGLLLEERTH